MSSPVESLLETCKRFAAYKIRLKALRAEVDETSGVVKAMEPPLLAALAAAGLRQLVIGDLMLFTKREPWIRPVAGIPRQQICEALKIAGLGAMVKENFSTNSLTAHLKALEQRSKLIVGPEEDGGSAEDALRKLLHPALRDLVNVRAAFTLSVRRKDDPYAESQEARNHEQGEEASDEF